MADVGRPSQLDDEQFLLKIKELFLDGKTEREMQQILEVPVGTWDYWKWKNYQGFADKLLSYKHERIIQKAEANLEQLLEGDDDRIRADLSKFALETLSKKNYSKRSELGGLDGQPLVMKFDGVFNDGTTPSTKENSTE